jgi:hypothetical protein
MASCWKTFGAASFGENGFVDKEVPHAHLHAMPVRVPVSREWVTDGTLIPLTAEC